MQRASAILLLVQFSLSLIAPALFAGSDVNLPACCRKDGKHHCSMQGGTSGMDDQASGAGIQGVKAKCPSFPKGEAAPASAKAGAPVQAQVYIAAVVSYPAASAHAETQYRVSLNRAWQKRGPPSLLS